MPITTLLLIILLWVVALCSATTLVICWRKLNNSGTPYLKALTLAVTLWCFFYGCEIASRPLGLHVMQLWYMASWVNITFIGVLWFLFARGLSGHRTNLGYQLLLFSIPLIILFTIVSNPQLELMWSKITMGPIGVNARPTGFFWLHYGYSYSLYVLGLIIITFQTSRAHYSRRTQLGVITITSFLATLFNIWCTNISYSFDPSAIIFATMLCVVVCVISQDAFTSIVPIARDIVVDTLTLGMVMLDSEKRIVDANWIFQKITATSLHDIRLKAIDDVFMGDFSPLQKVVQRDIDTKVSYKSQEAYMEQRQTTHNIIPLPTGRVLKTYTTPIVNIEKQPWPKFLRWLGVSEPADNHDGQSNRHDYQGSYGQIILLEDVSKQVLQEEALREAKDKAEIANQTQRNFLAVMGHELRTPLTIIRGYSEMIRDYSDDLDRDMVLEFAQHISQANESLSYLVENILQYSALDDKAMELRWQKVDIAQIVHHIHSDRDAQLKEKRNVLKLETIPETLELVSDYQKVYYIIDQLVDNGIKFTKEGSISIAAEIRKKDTVFTYQEGEQYLWVQVCDTGVGIAPANHEHIFQAFTQETEGINRLYGGGGVGLALCRRYAQMLGGELTVDSEQGQGSCFTLTLPLEKKL